jgi:hypothetical protein
VDADRDAYTSGLLAAAVLSLCRQRGSSGRQAPHLYRDHDGATQGAVFDRTASALIGAGYRVGEVNAIAITTAKRTFKHVWDLQLSANVLSAGDSLRIVLTGTYWVPGMGVSNEAVVGGRSGVAG